MQKEGDFATKMERLTKRNGAGGIDVEDVEEAIKRLAEYEDTGLSPEVVDGLLMGVLHIYKIGEFISIHQMEPDGRRFC